MAWLLFFTAKSNTNPEGNPSHIVGNYVNYLAEATRRWPNARIVGNGAFAVVNPAETVCYLATDDRQQRNVALGVTNPTLVNLLVRDILEMADEIPDRWPD